LPNKLQGKTSGRIKSFNDILCALMEIAQISAQIRQRRVSPVELTKECLDRIDKLNPKLNAFITVTAESARAEARAAESEIQAGHWRGPLHGIPIALKDLIDTAGVRTTAASAMFKDRVPSDDAEVVRHLKAAGAVFLGKQNLHEFAYGGSSLVSYFGEVRNPWNPQYVAGGSSGGSAAAVTAGLCYAAIGTDTAGSIREPAAFCGIVGLKPTYGRVSARGVIPLSWSLDHVGPLATTVADAALMLQALAGPDPGDPHSADIPVDNYAAALDAPTRKLRLGIPRSFFYEDLHSEVASAMDQALSVLSTMTAEVRETSLPVPTDRRLQSAESYAYHASFVATSSELYQPETLRRIQSGQNVSAEDRARLGGELHEIRRGADHIFEGVDLLVTPTVPIPPPTIAELKENPEGLRPREILMLRNTRPFNVWGLPAISVPCGFTREGLPIGLQIAGPHWQEARVLSLAHAYETATAWHERHPALDC
jgi:aspartyl-tRNA(Asn)/glutamyl-tRNA(Gln) amidotransferase subunit A